MELRARGRVRALDWGEELLGVLDWMEMCAPERGEVGVWGEGNVWELPVDVEVAVPGDVCSYELLVICGIPPFSGDRERTGPLIGASGELLASRILGLSIPPFVARPALPFSGDTSLALFSGDPDLEPK